jgi:hypothetical protein
MKTENDKIAQELFEKGYKLFHEEHDYKGAEKGRAR